MQDISFRDFSPEGQKLLKAAFYERAQRESDLIRVLNGALTCEAGRYCIQKILICGNLIEDSLKLWHGPLLRFENDEEPAFKLFYLFGDQSLVFFEDDFNTEPNYIPNGWEVIEEEQFVIEKFEPFFEKRYIPSTERPYFLTWSYAERLEAETASRNRRLKRSESMKRAWARKKAIDPEAILQFSRNCSEWMKRYWSLRRASAAKPAPVQIGAS